MKSKMSIKSIIIMAIISLISMLFINVSLAANTGKINVETANLRETADAESKILIQLSQNQEVEILEKAGDWYKVKSNDITGYLRQDLVTVNEENTAPTNTQNNEAVQVNTTAETTQNETNTNENTSNQVESNEAVQNTAEATKENIELGKYKVISNTKLKLVPLINATDVIEVKENEEVEVIEVINGWACIETQSTKGWIRKDKLQKDEQKVEKNEEETTIEQPTEQPATKTRYINSATVNVRKEANTTSEIVTTVAQNTPVEVSLEENGWSKVKVNNVEGYISTELLSDTKQETTSRSSSTSRKATKTVEKASSEQTANTVPTSNNGAAIVATAKKYLGYKYVYGGSSPSTGFDCSGFTSYVYKQHGITINRTAAGQYSNGVAVNRANLQPGDLVMFGSPINHVAIYIGGGQIIHASTPSTGVRIDSLTSGYYNNKYVGARRII